MAPRPLSIILVFVISIFTLFVLTIIVESLLPVSQAGSPSVPRSVPLISAPPVSAPAPVEAAFYLVYTKRPKNEKMEIYHLHILSSVLGSEEASKAALFRSYKYMDCSFSALLTTDQVEELSKKPGVLQIVKLATSPISLSHF